MATDMAHLIALQDASRAARSDYMLPGQTAAEESAALDRFRVASKAYEDALFAYMAESGRGKRAYDDIEEARRMRQESPIGQ